MNKTNPTNMHNSKRDKLKKLIKMKAIEKAPQFLRLKGNNLKRKDLKRNSTIAQVIAMDKSRRITNYNQKMTSNNQKIDEEIPTNEDSKDEDLDYYTKFLEPNFNASTFLKTNISSKKKPQDLYEDLISTQERARNEVKEHVHNNYLEFMNITKELTDFESQTIKLNKYATEMKNLEKKLQKLNMFNKNQANENMALENSTNDKKSKEVTKNKEVKSMQDLWETVLGSQQLLPHIEGRRVVYRSAQWDEVDSTTFRVKRTIIFYTLTDTLLISTRSNRQTIADPSKDTANERLILIARESFSLKNIKLKDIKDQKELKNAFKLANNDTAYIFCTKNKEEKGMFLKYLVKSMHNYMIKNKEKEAEKKEKNHEHLDIELKSKLDVNISEEEFSNKIESALFSREFGEIIRIFEKAQKSQLFKIDENGYVSFYSTSEFEELLEGYICEIEKIIKNNVLYKLSLCDDINSYQELKIIYELGFKDKAVELFLSIRSDSISQRENELLFCGNPVEYVLNLTIVIFKSITKTIKWTKILFGRYEYSSKLNNWCFNEIVIKYVQNASIQLSILDKDELQKELNQINKTIKTYSDEIHDLSSELVFDYVGQLLQART